MMAYLMFPRGLRNDYIITDIFLRFQNPKDTWKNSIHLLGCLQASSLGSSPWAETAVARDRASQVCSTARGLLNAFI